MRGVFERLRQWNDKGVQWEEENDTSDVISMIVLFIPDLNTQVRNWMKPKKLMNYTNYNFLPIVNL